MRTKNEQLHLWSKTLGICLSLLLSLWIAEGQRGRSVPNRRTAIVLDNPTKEAISCNIDGIDYTVVAKGRRYLQLSNGEHYMVYDGDTTTFVKEARDGGSILNPTGSSYIAYGQNYANGKYDLDIIYCGYYLGTEVEGETYYTSIRVYTERYIKRSSEYRFGKWLWGLDETMPREYNFPNMKPDNKLYQLRKLYRYSDFQYLYKKDKLVKKGFAFDDTYFSKE